MYTRKAIVFGYENKVCVVDSIPKWVDSSKARLIACRLSGYNVNWSALVDIVDDCVDNIPIDNWLSNMKANYKIWDNTMGQLAV